MTDNCKHVSKIKTSIQLGILNPERWHCKICNTTESVWACLSCTNFSCGRYINEHALQHFQTHGHPLCIEVNEKFVFCYLCDDFVLNDNAPGDIKLLRMALDAVSAQNFDELYKQRRGRRILRYHMRDAKKITRRLLKADDIQTAVARHRFSRLSWAIRVWWSRYMERRHDQKVLGTTNRASNSKKGSVCTAYPAAFTGLRNLGNTCYVNSILQVLRHTAPFANFIMSHAPHELLQSRKRPLSMATNNQSNTEFLGRSASKRSTSTLSALSPQSAAKLSTSTQPTSGPVSSSAKCSGTQPSPAKIVRVGDGGGGLIGGHSVRSSFPSACTTDACATAASGSTVAKPALDDSGDTQDPPSLYSEIYSVFRLLWSGQRTVISPSSLLYTIWTTIPTFKGYKQQDAQEFLSLFLDRLQSELHTASSSAPGTGSAVVPVNARDFVNRTFQGQSVSHICCSVCRKVTCTEEAFSELSLALPPACYAGEASECSLVDLLQQYVSPTPIDGQGYACRACSTAASADTRVPEDSEPVKSSSQSWSEADSGSSPLLECRSSPSDLSCTSSANSPKRNSPFKFEKLVSVSLSRLSPSTFTTTWTAAATAPPTACPPACSTSSPPQSSSSFSSSDLSGSPSLASLDETFDATATPGTTASSCLSPRSVAGRQRSSSPPTACRFGDLSRGRGITSSTRCTGERDGLGRCSGAAAGDNPFSPAATQTIRLARLPRVLRLHIKRFRWVGKQREKVNCHVSFPLILDLSEFMLSDADRASCCCSANQCQPVPLPSSDRATTTATTGESRTGQAAEPPSRVSSASMTYCQRRQENQPGQRQLQRCLYHLTGVIVHYGRGFQSGHYTAYCLNDKPECWLHCNDVNVSVCDFSEVAAAQAYLLFYSELVPSSPYPAWCSGLRLPSLGPRRHSSSLVSSSPSADVELTEATLCSLRRVATDSQCQLARSADCCRELPPKPGEA